LGVRENPETLRVSLSYEPLVPSNPSQFKIVVSSKLFASFFSPITVVLASQIEELRVLFDDCPRKCDPLDLIKTGFDGERKPLRFRAGGIARS
jgi:hypothetical protein